MPPLEAGVVVVRVWVIVPPPHVTEQVPPVHADCTQLTGHACVLHATLLVAPLVAGHAAPPFEADATIV